MIVSLLEMGKRAQRGKYLVPDHQLVNNRAVWLSLDHPEVQDLGQGKGPELHPGQAGYLEP